jgi:hypothetical protein
LNNPYALLHYWLVYSVDFLWSSEDCHTWGLMTVHILLIHVWIPMVQSSPFLMISLTATALISQKLGQTI